MARSPIASSRTTRHLVYLAGASVIALSLSSAVAFARSLNGGGSGGAVSAPNIASDAATQAAQQAAVAAQQSQQSLARAARAVQDMQGIQNAARAAAAAAQMSVTAPMMVPNGLGAGGLLPNMPAGWTGANAPTQGSNGGSDGKGQTEVNIRQTTQQAILNWQSFNVGARTTLTFDQQGNGNWVALNRINNATAPSQILGNIKADGHVYVINRSGVIFGGNSQVNVGSLIASTADIDDTHFRANGIYSTQTGTNQYTPSFTAAGGKVLVESGASIGTRPPSSVTAGGGYVLMIGSQVESAGSISTPKGQTLLAAGDSFVLRRGFGTEGNATSTTRGIEISPTITGNSGIVRNSGLIFAQQGDITLAGRTLNQSGVLLSSSSVNTRGTIHLANSAADRQGSVTLAAGSVTAILPELDSSETALDSQRDALITSSAAANLLRAASATGKFDNLSVLADRQDQSRIEIVTGGTVTFQNQSQTMAQGGQVAVSAGTRVFAETGASIDVSGTRGALLPMSANQVLVNVQGNELRDSPINRDSGALINKNVWIDIRDLVLLPAGTGGYANDRYYTKGGLLELGGYLSNTAHKIGEWTAVGGTITLAAPEVIAQAGATFDISGGSVSYDGGRIYSSKLIGADGRIYSFDNAPADIKFIGSAGGFSRTHNIQGQIADQLTEIWSTVFDRSSSWRYEAGYTVGRDAGRLNLSTPTALFAAEIIADVVTGERQNSARAAATADGYKQVQNATPLAGTLAVGQYTALGQPDLYDSNVRIGDVSDITTALGAANILPAGRANTVWFDARHLSEQGLGGLQIGTRGTITIDGDLTLANGGALGLIGPLVDIKADIIAHGGSIDVTNVFASAGLGTVNLTSNGTSQIAVRTGARLDLSGMQSLDSPGAGLPKLAYLNGGTVSLRSTGNVMLEDKALIDVSSGATTLRTGKVQGGRGGLITLRANLNGLESTGELTLAGIVRGYGMNGGGALILQSDRIAIGAASDIAAGTLTLAADFFAKGFETYTIIGNRGVTVADGAVVDVTMPVYRPADMKATGLEVWTPPVYTSDLMTGALTQRGGASLTLQAGNSQLQASDLPLVGLTIGKNTAITVDPGKSIALSSVGQLTVDGTLHAAGGSISLKTINLLGSQVDHAAATTNSRSIWIGERARLDVAAQAVMARDAQGGRHGLVANGGSIVIGGEIDSALGQATGSNNFIVVRPGAVLDASGTTATIVVAGLGAVDVASNGGSISLISNNGLFLDGTMLARAGGAGAAGGSLNVALQMLEYRIETYDPANLPLADSAYRAQRRIVLADTQGASVLAAGLKAGAADAAMTYGYARLGADTVARGGFDNLAVMSTAIGFDGNVTLRVGQSLNLYSDMMMPIAGSAQDARITLQSAYARLGQINYVYKEPDSQKSRIPVFTADPTRYDVQLDVAAKLIDIRDTVNLTFGKTLLHSDGDLRFVQGVRPMIGLISTSLATPGSLTLRAAQVYPTTGTVAEVQVGFGNRDGVTGYDPAQILRIEANSTGTPDMPYSVFGDLTLAAAVVEQAGVVRAPLGKLTIGAGGYDTSKTSLVTLMPGSLTSVSGGGLMMPYGGTIDGLSYNYNGKEVTLVGVGGTGMSSTLKVGISLGGMSAVVESGAVLDLSGGGNLVGAGFITGRGGSVDIRTTAFANANPGNRFSAGGNAVYAIVPNFKGDYAPVGSENSASDPRVGRQITLDGSVPGLPAGTYTLMPATYALLPGAFRIEIGAQQSRAVIAGANAVGNGSYLASGQLGFANTAIRDSLASQIVVTPGAVLRSYSNYNETSFADYVIADAVKRGVPRAMLPVDARSLVLNLNPGAGIDAFRFNGRARFDAARGGYGGAVMVATNSGGGANIEVVAAGGSASAGFDGLSIDSSILNALGASRIVIGGIQYVTYGQGGRLIESHDSTQFIYLRPGSLLAAPEVFLMANSNNTRTGAGIVIEQGARINTIGQGAVAYDARDGYVYAGVGNHLMVSNGLIDLMPNSAAASTVAASGVRIGVCDSGNCSGQTEIYSEGTLALVTPNQFQMNDTVRYGTRNLTLSVSRINLGDSAVLDDAAARNILPSGLSMNQALLDRLLRGDTRYGAPGLETLTLAASSAVNIFGSVTLDTVNPATGKSTLANLVLGTPAIYGAGNAGDIATIRTGNFIWRGSTLAPGELVAGGAGTGSGTLNIAAERIVFGYGPNSRPTGRDVDGRMTLGFANVNLSASDRVSANQQGNLSVYQSRGAYAAGQGYSYNGGNLTITAPLVTGEGGSVNSITTGDALHLVGAGAAGVVGSDALGAQLTLNGGSIALDTSIVLPSGKLALKATNDITLTGASQIDMSGREIVFNDVRKYSWGGDVTLDSRRGSVRQASGSVIDLSARYNNAGSLTAIALDAAAGTVDLQGEIRGTSTGHYDAGGTLVPYRAGSANIRAQTLGDFAALNARLNAGGVYGARSFQIKQGDLNIGNELKANEINVSLDNGRLIVVGTIDASGESVGTIRLAARNGLTLTGSAVLDAHGTVLRVDSYGKIIDSPNRAIVELNSGNGRLTLAQGARVDLRHGTDAPIGNEAGQNDGRARGTLELNAPRIGSNGLVTDTDAVTYGDLDIDVSGMPTIQGARTIAVNAMRRYDDAPDTQTPAANGRPYQYIDQAWLDGKHADSNTFINAALGRGALTAGKLAGLNNATYRDVFHLRPGVEVVSKTPDGDLVVQGDLDLSRYRYASLNPHAQLTGIYGSGESGALTLRAGGDLNIYGSINDGFAQPPATQDDKGWVLRPGKEFTGEDIVIPRTGVVLATGTIFFGTNVLNFDLPIRARSFAAGFVIPVASTLNAVMNLTPGTVVSANIRSASGTILFAAGTIITTATRLPVGTRFDAGWKMPVLAGLAAMVWPKGVALPGAAAGQFLLNGNLTLPMGALLPSGTDIKLPAGIASVDLRPSGAGRLWALGAMLPEGSQSWSIRLVAGADTAAADSRLINPHAIHGDLTLADHHYGLYAKPTPESYVLTQYGWDTYIGEGDPADYVGKPITDFVDSLGSTICSDDARVCGLGANPTFDYGPASSRFSVLRTGAADLDLLSAANLQVKSLYGVYTAGTSSTTTSANDPYNLPRTRGASGTVLADLNMGYEKFVDGGPDSLARAWYPTGGGNLTIKAGGDLTGNLMNRPITTNGFGRPNRLDIGYDSAAIGNWLWRQGTGATFGGGADQATAWWINFGSYVSPRGQADTLIGFTGFGTLGGGNLRVDVGGNAGILAPMTVATTVNQRTEGLVLTVGSTGRVGADGNVTLTGGGDLDLRIGGKLNPASLSTNNAYNGTVTNLRGDTQIAAASMGSLTRIYGNSSIVQSPRETRAYDLFTSTRAEAFGGLLLAPGDSTFALNTTGDLTLTGAIDPGRVPTAIDAPFGRSGGAGGNSWFSLWTDHSAINLFSAGGDLVPVSLNNTSFIPSTDSAILYPPILTAIAAGGSFYYGNAISDRSAGIDNVYSPLLLAPSAKGKLEFLASESIYAGGYTVARTSASASSLATPFRPAFMAVSENTGATIFSNLLASGNVASPYQDIFPLFAFGPNTAAAEWGAGNPTRFYAVKGDLVGVSSGRIVTFAANDPTRAGQTWYQGAGPVRMIAGRDIVGSGTAIETVEDGLGSSYQTYFSSTGNLFVHNAETDVSLVQAGHDLIYSSFNVGGPGTLQIFAGRNIQMDDKASVVSVGPVVAGDGRAGANVAMQAGVANAAPDYQALLRYLDPTNLVPAGIPLENSGKVAKTYEKELAAWLQQRTGFAGSDAEARIAFGALPAEQQQIFLRQVYFAELTAGGREYNNPASTRYLSYLRGREAIAALFPGKAYGGDITMFAGSGVRTVGGGDISMFTPGGRLIVGTEGLAPPGTAGLITQGEGDIQIYSQGSVLLGLSRIMTTFGGNIIAWTAGGDINAGRGAKTTVVYTPPKRVYDAYGNVTLSPQVPSSGAGIATLNPIPEVKAGDIDLIAPLGTIDAGEAGIRVSGNINLAALQIVNAANISVQGSSSGIPTVQAPSISAALSSSNATAATQQTAQPSQSANAQPSVIIVEVLGYGGGENDEEQRRKRETRSEYDPNSAFQLIGNGPLTPQQRSELTSAEQARLDR